ncbi:MAG TPA: hypothetical protein VM840_09965 [Actinomycetota bacterium]|nr:hypothetical protein [Actinomycetota bacterium]
MLKRIRWLLLGAMAGVGLYVWAREKAKQMPTKAVDAAAARGAEVAQSATARGRELGARLREALREGREAMREREAELRAELERSNGQTPYRAGPT